MAKLDQISSTEKLLDLIRNKREPISDTPEHAPSLTSQKIKRLPFFQSISFNKPITVGVEIGYTELRLVKMKKHSDDKREIVDFLKVPFDPEITKDSPQFPKALQSILKHFCPPAGAMQLWCSMSSAQVETRYFTVPNVPKKKLNTTVLWTFKKETPFDLKEVIFDYEILENVLENQVRKIGIVAYTVPKEKVYQLRDMFLQIGFPLTGITVVPFSLQNILRTRWIDIGANTICHLYMGRDWSRIDIYSKGNLKLSRGIKAGIHSMAETINAELEDRQGPSTIDFDDPAEPFGDAADETDAYSSMDYARDLLYGKVDESRGENPQIKMGLNKKNSFDLIAPALERLVRQVERTIGHYGLKYDSAGMEKIFFAGPLSNNTRLVDYIRDQLGLQGGTLDPFPSRPDSEAKMPGPESAPDRNAFMPAVGIALSDNSFTPNFLFTYEDKDRILSVKRINRAILVGFLIGITLCSGIFFRQNNIVKQKSAQVARLENELGKFDPRVDQDFIQQMIGKAGSNRNILKSFGKRYLSMAVISEISKSTPRDIRLLSIAAEFGGLINQKDEKPKQSLALVGVIFGDRLSLESALTGYMVTLKTSPLFDRLELTRKSLDRDKDDKEFIRFTLELGIKQV
ncbi:MAG: hypothetical protein Q8P24_09275 [Desulfobacterales bacterium]|nr:hypothetical protein [Desulfobacterales bacterium]